VPAAKTAAPPRSGGFWKLIWGSSSSKAEAHQTTPADTAREIVETVVFVVVLVLLLKSFVAEAFVIPTGSMAETLWGYQKVVTCPECGFQFPVNCSSQVDPQNGDRPILVTGGTCPNCRLPIRFLQPGSDLVKPAKGDIPDPGYSSGDRVLVAKFLYDLFPRDPDRLDVVVFKYPGDDKFPYTGPFKNHVPMNYIKRLIGLPGETIAIYQGNLYRLPPDKSPKYPEQDSPINLWRKRYMHEQFIHGDDDKGLKAFHDAGYEIIRKPPATLLAMRRIVYDNDHQAKDLIQAGQPPRWAGIEKDVWVAAGTSFKGKAADDKLHWLRYSHLLRDGHGKPELITDFMGYNSWQGGGHPGHPSPNWVGDLTMECEATVDANQGELILELSKGTERFRARFDVATGFCTLSRVTPGLKEESLGSKETALKGTGRHFLRFANVDDRLTVWVDGSLPFDHGQVYIPAAAVGPTKENDLEPASIAIKGASATIRQLRLYRDTYYTVGHDSPHDADYVDIARRTPMPVRMDEPESWGPLRQLPVKTLYVQPDHFLCLGDNSPESSDGRSWGLVPRRLLLGRALLVYWPSYVPYLSQVNRVGLIE